MLIGQSLDKNYGNSFSKKEKNCIGVVTFGSPSFLTNLTAGYKMKAYTSYFYNIKERNYDDVYGNSKIKFVLLFIDKLQV